MRGTGLVDGIQPVIIEPVAVQDATSRQTEPRVTLFATDPARMHGFGQIRADGRVVTLADLKPGEIYLNARGADKLAARPGDTVQLLSGSSVSVMRVKAIVRYQGGATDGAGVLMPLTTAQSFLGKPGLVRALFVSNPGGVAATDAVMRGSSHGRRRSASRPTAPAGRARAGGRAGRGVHVVLHHLRLVLDRRRDPADLPDLRDARRRAAQGARDRPGRRDAPRAPGAALPVRGMAYDCWRRSSASLLGIAVAYGMVLAMAAAFSASEDLHMAYAVKPTSLCSATRSACCSRWPWSRSRRGA